MLETFPPKADRGVPQEHLFPIWQLTEQELRDVYNGKFQNVLDQIRFVQDAEARNAIIDVALEDVDAAVSALSSLADQHEDAGNVVEEQRITRMLGALHRFEDELDGCYFD